MSRRNCAGGVGLNAVAANAAAAARTVTVSNANQFSQIAFFVSFTRSAGTAVTMSVAEHYDSSDTTDYTQQALDGSSTPTLDSGDKVISKTTSATGAWVWRVDVDGEQVEAVFAVTGGGASDYLTVKWRGVV